MESQIEVVLDNFLKDSANKEIAHDMLRTICRTYLTILIKLTYGIDNTTDGIRLSINGTLVDLRNQISVATGMTCDVVQTTFEQYAAWISISQYSTAPIEQQ